MQQTHIGFKVTLFIPLVDNDGVPFGPATWHWWNVEFTSLVKAFTDLGVATGSWRGHLDQNRVIVMVVKTMKEVEAIRRLLVEARRHFRQEAMYLEYHRVYFEEVR